MDKSSEFITNHGSSHNTGSDKGRPQVYGHHFVEILIIHLNHQTVAGNAGIVDEDADATVGVCQFLERLCQFFGLRDVHLTGDNRMTGFGSDFFQFCKLLGIQVQTGDLTPLVQQF